MLWRSSSCSDLQKKRVLSCLPFGKTQPSLFVCGFYLPERQSLGVSAHFYEHLPYLTAVIIFANLFLESFINDVVGVTFKNIDNPDDVKKEIDEKIEEST